VLSNVRAQLGCRPGAVGFLAIPLSLISTRVANAADVPTYHNDIGRAGQKLNEPTLTPSNVKSSTFARLITISGVTQLGTAALIKVDRC